MIYRICYGSALGCKFKNCSFFELRWLKLLMKTVLLQAAVFEGGYWQNVFAEESKFTGCDFNETVFKYGVSAVFAAICQSERACRQVILDETRLTDSELSECKVQGLQLRAADLTRTNCFKTYFSGTV